MLCVRVCSAPQGRTPRALPRSLGMPASFPPRQWSSVTTPARPGLGSEDQSGRWGVVKGWVARGGAHDNLAMREAAKGLVAVPGVGQPPLPTWKKGPPEGVMSQSRQCLGETVSILAFCPPGRNFTRDVDTVRGA